MLASPADRVEADRQVADDDAGQILGDAARHRFRVEPGVPCASVSQTASRIRTMAASGNSIVAVMVRIHHAPSQPPKHLPRLQKTR